jgi:hypothetical protein
MEHDKATLLSLVEAFRKAVVAAQKPNQSVGLNHKYTRDYVDAFQRLTAIGDEGREALCVLLDDTRPEVRSMAAAFLLRYKHERAKRVLQRLSTGRGLVAFGAGQCLERWKEGAWALDPEPRPSRKRKVAKGAPPKSTDGPSNQRVAADGRLPRSARSPARR